MLTFLNSDSGCNTLIYPPPLRYHPRLFFLGLCSCIQPYWPQEAGASVTHGDITIECKELEERSGFLRSVHTVTKGEGGESRPLEHYWYV